jgi:SARP family transcriptional regulator, regulator of embCAB operon
MSAANDYEPSSREAPAAGAELRVELIGGFRLLHGGSAVALSRGAERLLAFLCLSRQAVRRIFVAGSLWPDVTERRAYAALRAALARLDRASRAALAIGPLSLSLAAGVAVDFDEAQSVARELLNPAIAAADPAFGANAIPVLSSELLPGWYDDWVVSESEGWRQLRLHALESIAVGLIGARRYGDAAAAASAAVRADPLRESARVAMIRVHLAEGNLSEAIRDFERFERLLDDELHVAPSSQLRGLVSFPSRPYLASARLPIHE